MGLGAAGVWGGTEELQGGTMYDGVGWYTGAGDRAWPLLGNCGMVLGNCGWTCRAVGWPGKLFDGPGELWAVTLELWGGTTSKPRTVIACLMIIFYAYS